jgi:hypothetical protein
MKNTATPTGGFYMLAEEISFESVENACEEKVIYADDDFYPDASF